MNVCYDDGFTAFYQSTPETLQPFVSRALREESDAGNGTVRCRDYIRGPPFRSNSR